MATDAEVRAASAHIAAKAPCRVATTGNITLSAPQTIDGVSLVADDRVLVWQQSNAVQNGIWEVQSGAWRRAWDLDGIYDATQGLLAYVHSGSTGSGIYELTTAEPVVGETGLTWRRWNLVNAFPEAVLNASGTSTVSAQGSAEVAVAAQAGNAGDAHLSLPGTSGNYASTPDSVAISITGDIDIRIRCASDDWDLPSSQRLVSKRPSATTIGYDFFLNSGFPRLEWSSDGTTLNSAQSTVVLPTPDGSVVWIRVTLDVDNGAVGRDINFYTSNDGTTWTQLGTTVTQAGLTSIFDNNAQLVIGNLEQLGFVRPFVGNIYYAEMRNGIDGPVVAVFDPANRAVDGALTMSSQTGETWTINQSGSPAAQLIGNASRGLASSALEISVAASAAGIATCLAVGAADGPAAASSAGSSTADAVSGATDTEALSVGSATAQAVGTVEIRAAGQATGAATATAEPAFMLSAAGIGAATGVGAVQVTAVFSGAGLSTCTAATGASNPVWIIGNSGGTRAVERYALSDDTVTSHTALDTAQDDSITAAAGNATRAILHGSGSFDTQALKYTYATEATSNSATMGSAIQERAASQTSTTGYFFGGNSDPNAGQTAVDKVTFSTDARTAGTALNVARTQMQAAGNDTRAIVGGGRTTFGVSALSSTTKYTYSGDSVAAGTALGTARAEHGAAGNTTRGIFGGGYNSSGNQIATTEKYTYSGDSRTAGTTLTNASQYGAAGDNIVGVFVTDDSPSLTRKYTYSDDTVSAGTALTTVRANPACACESPGGL